MNSHTEKAEKQSGELFRCTGRSGGQQVLPCAEKQDMSKTEAMLHYEQTDHNCELVPRVVVECITCSHDDVRFTNLTLSRNQLARHRAAGHDVREPRPAQRPKE